LASYQLLGLSQPFRHGRDLGLRVILDERLGSQALRVPSNSSTALSVSPMMVAAITISFDSTSGIAVVLVAVLLALLQPLDDLAIDAVDDAIEVGIGWLGAAAAKDDLNLVELVAEVTGRWSKRRE
jgi:hypothetical protein